MSVWLSSIPFSHIVSTSVALQRGLIHFPLIFRSYFRAQTKEIKSTIGKKNKKQLKPLAILYNLPPCWIVVLPGGQCSSKKFAGPIFVLSHLVMKQRFLPSDF